LDNIALAITLNPEEPVRIQPGGGIGKDRKRTQIQLCPWFLDWLKTKEFKFFRDLKRTNIGLNVIKLAESSKFTLRQIGAFNASFPELTRC
jgi:hypothetical protein